MARYTGGWIKLHRKLLRNEEMFDDAPMLALWVLLLMWANRKDSATELGGQALRLVRGQLCTSPRELARKLKLHRGVVDRRLRCLEHAQMISQQTSHHGTIISIMKYDDYQTNSNEASHATSNRRATDEPPASHRRANSGEEKKNNTSREPPYIPPGGFEGGQREALKILATAAAIRDEGVGSRSEARERFGEVAWAAIHSCGSFDRFWHEYWTAREPTSSLGTNLTGEDARKARDVTDAKYRDRLAAVILDPGFDPAKVLARIDRRGRETIAPGRDEDDRAAADVHAGSLPASPGGGGEGPEFGLAT